MSIYILCYVLVTLFLLFTSIRFYKKYKNKSGLFFLLSNIFLAIWFIMYFTSFFTTDSYSLLLMISRIAYATGVISIFYFILFVGTFKSTPEKIKKTSYGLHFLLVSIVLVFYIGTPLIIEGLVFIDYLGDYYEKTGKLFFIYPISFIGCIIGLIIVSIKKIYSLNNINKLRLQNILFGFILFMVLAFFILTILPLYEIYILQKEIVFFLIPYVIFTYYSLHRYYFFDLSIGIGKLSQKILSLLLSILILISIRYFYGFFGVDFNSFWGNTEHYNLLDIGITIILYIIIDVLMKGIFKGNKQYAEFQRIMNVFKNKISFLHRLDEVNAFLGKEIIAKFQLTYANITIVKNLDKNNQIYQYFKQNIDHDVLINDVVFIEENKHRFHKKVLEKELVDQEYLLLPIRDNKMKVIGWFSLGKKPFGEPYYSDEMPIIKDFVDFLSGHLKYMETYEKMQVLNLNLDKEVDRKTIEYNALINKQKEFISLISHEIKGPISAGIFQLDCMLDDLKDNDLSGEQLRKELEKLNEQLLKTGELTTRLFSVQSYDLDTITLFKEEIRVIRFIEDELEVFRNIYPEINFQLSCSEDIGFMYFDKVQVKQVIDNLLNNSIKFIHTTNPKIICKISKENSYVCFEIEDNGIGFKGIDVSNIFDKYSTGMHSSIGLGMGLYLCKKIVEMHGGEISATNSKELKGAKFQFTLPL